MTSPYSVFQTNETLEREGITVDYGAFRFRVARAGGSNKRYAQVMAARMKPYRRAIQTDTMDEDVAKRVLQEVFVDTVLLGWEDVTGKDGQPLAYTRENALNLFIDLPDLFTDLFEQAKNVALFREHLTELDAKN